MRIGLLASATVAATLALAAPAPAQPGAGPVAAACQQDIEKLCAKAEHGQGAVRACLETNKARVSAACTQALETTGPGRRR